MPNGLVPQAPVHTDSLTNYETRLDVIKTKDHDITEIRRPLVEATAVVEQRISHFLMGLALWGTMTGPLLIVLHTMPAAVFAGVFFVVGVSDPLHIGSDKLFPELTASPVGLYRIQRHSSKAHLSQLRTAFHPTREPAERSTP